MFCQAHKKGITRDFLLFLIITVLGVIIIMLVLGVFMGRLDNEISEDVCRASVLARAKGVLEINIKGAEIATISLLPITCKTKHDVKLSGDKDQIMEQISYMSARCWWMFLNGEYRNLFNQHHFLSRKRCFKCYIFTIDERNIEISPDDLIKHMDENYFIRHEDQEISYLEYIQSYKGDGAIMMRDEFKLKSGGIYTISFVSPDITTWGIFTNYIGTGVQFWKSGTQKDKEREEIIMSGVIIEELKALNDNTAGECWELESI